MISVNGALLAPFSKLYDQITYLRNIAYDKGIFSSYSSSLPVCSVGNLTVGGNGKTPFTLFLSEYIQKKHKAPVILTRGYGGTCRGPHRVTPSDAASEVGDEPLMMAQSGNAPVVICRDRVKGARFIESQGLGDCILLDDGFQHRRLRRTIDIVCISVASEFSVNEFIGGKVLPQGRFRESKEEGLCRADFLVFAHQGPRDETRAHHLGNVVPLSLARVESWMVAKELVTVNRHYNNENTLPIEVLKRSEVIGACGLARPEGFFSLLKQISGQLVATERVGDHSPLSIDRISALSYQFPKALVIISEKDAVKLRSTSEKFPDSMYWLRVEVKVSDESKLDQALSVFLHSDNRV